MLWNALFNVELPVIQAPMAGAQDSSLAIAVCNAGGLGSLPCALLSPDQIRLELAALRTQVGAPYNLNFFCHRPPRADAAREARWRDRLKPYYEELGVDTTPPRGAGRMPFDDAAATLVEEFRPPVVSFHFGLPEPPLLARVRAAGARVLSTATTVDEARWLENQGVDAVIAQGIEAGGHRGHFMTGDLATQQPTLSLVSEIVRAVRVPVVAAGGICNAATAAEAFRAGASAVQAGTAYLFCPEASVNGVHRAALTSDAARTTAVTNVMTGRPARGIVNRLMRELGPMNGDVPEFPLAAGAVQPLRAAAEQRGSGDFSALWAGTRASECRQIPAAALTRELGSTMPR